MLRLPLSWSVQMDQVRFPLSGDVIQSLLPWNFLNGAQFGVINISLGKSPDPSLEHEILEEVGSYGRQLGRVGEALAVLLAHFQPKRPLTDAEEKALFDLRRMLADIADVRAGRDRSGG
jgi:hypothetical protein